MIVEVSYFKSQIDDGITDGGVGSVLKHIINSSDSHFNLRDVTIGMVGKFNPEQFTSDASVCFVDNDKLTAPAVKVVKRFDDVHAFI